MDLPNVAVLERVGESFGLALQAFEECMARITLAVFMWGHDFLRAGAVIAKPLAKRDMNVERQQPPLPGRGAQVLTKVGRSVLGRPGRSDWIRRVPGQCKSGEGPIRVPFR